MKKLYFLLFIFLLTQNLWSQEDDGYQTIFNGGVKRISGFGGPFYNFSMVNGEFVLFSGGGGALLINDFYIGGFGVGSTTPIQYTRNQDISMSYGGIWIGYSFLGNRPIHPTFSLQTGWGKLKTEDDNLYSIISSVPYYSFEDKIFVVNPELGLELNIARFFRLSAAVNYRVVGGLDDPSYLSFTEASGLGINFALKFGWF